MYDIEFQGIKNGKIIRRFKEKSNIDYDESGILINGIVYEYAKLEGLYDRIKLIVDDTLWLNKSFLKFNFSSYTVGNEYEVSDDQKCWRKMELVRINEDEEYPFTCKNSQEFLFSWRFARALF